MRKLKRFAAFTVAVAIVLSLFSGTGTGVLTLLADAAGSGAISETYAEATELLTNLGIMNNSAKAWTDNVKGAEVNKVVYDLFFSTYNWSFAVFGRSDFAADQNVTGEALLYNLVPALGFYNGMDEQIWVDYFRLTRGIKDYDEKAALTREQTAQIMVNTLKAAHEYNRRSQEQRADFLGLHYTQVSADGLGRPTYQWIRTATNEAVSSTYAQEPIAVLSGGKVTWSDIFDAVGETKEESSLLAYWGDYWSFRPFSYQICSEGLMGDVLWTETLNGNTNPFQTNGYTVEIYDTYSKNLADIGGNIFTMQLFRLVCYADLLVECKTESGVKSVYMYGESSGNSYGAWSTAAGAPGEAFKDLADGVYTAHWSNSEAKLYEPELTTMVADKLTAINKSSASVTYGSTAGEYSTRFHKGYDLMADGNIGNVYSFYLDRNGYVVSMAECDHDYGSWTKVDASNHKRTCSKCGYAETGSHESELRNYVAPTVTAEGYSGDKYCKKCNALIESGTTLPKSTCVHVAGDEHVENDVPATCEQDGSYDTVVRCTECDTILTTTPGTHEALGHKWKESARVEPTDREAGYVDYVCENDATHTKHEDMPAKLAGKTQYPQAVEVYKALGMGDTANDIWGDTITGAEADQILQAMYDAPGFVDPRKVTIDTSKTQVTAGELMSGILESIGWNFNNDALFSGYNHLNKDLNLSYNSTDPLTREQAAQIVLNALKTHPAYNPECIKANDPGFGLTLVKAGEDASHRPSYKWQKSGADATAVYADTPIVTMQGGCSWGSVLEALNYVTTDGIPAAEFRWSVDGGDFSDWVQKVQPADGEVLTNDYKLEVYLDYSTYQKGFEYSIVATKSKAETPQETPCPYNTKYPEAVELAMAMGYIDTTNEKFSQTLTGAEANKMLNAMYAAAGFVDPWDPGLKADAKVSGLDFMSKALVTIAWNYNSDVLFSKFNHLQKGLEPTFSASMNLTREQACQIILNLMKTHPAYNLPPIKANDPGFGLTLTKVGEDEYHRPYYKWRRNGVDVTGVHLDTPVAVTRGGKAWNQILDAVGYHTTDGVPPAEFRWSVAGGPFSDWVCKKHPDTETLLNKKYKLEIYTDYTTAQTTFEYSIIAYEAPEEKLNTSYPEAVELMIALGWMNGDNTNWKMAATGAEANQVLDALYAGPGFAAPWKSNFSPESKVKFSKFMHDSLHTIAWDYENDQYWIYYNHLTKGLRGYNSGALTREQMAQIVLNVLKTHPVYNNQAIKGNDGNIGLTLVKVGQDKYNRPYYKWQKNGSDMTKAYLDSPVFRSQCGLTWSEILDAVGDVAAINHEQRFRFSEEGGDWSKYMGKIHPNFDVFKDADWAMEVYVDYNAVPGIDFTYSIVTYEGQIPKAGDTFQPVWIALLGTAALAGCVVLILTGKKKKKA